MTAQWAKTIFNISTMQEMTPEVCDATTKPAKTATAFDWDGSHRGDTNYVPRKSLRDSRDGNYYLVSKLADDNCWMSQSLALDLTANEPIIASNNDGTTTTVTPNNTTQTTTGTQWAEEVDYWHSYKPQSDEAYYQSGTTMSSSPSGSGETYDWEKAGNYYNWYTATAGTGTSSMADSDATASICPKGWRLPPNSGAKSYFNLIGTTYGFSTYASNTPILSLLAAPFNFNFSGWYNDYFGTLSGQGVCGMYWSSTAAQPPDSQHLPYVYAAYIGYGAGPQNRYDKDSGYSVRCVAI